MFECGQPLHAYDLDRLAGHRLVVRRARAGETLTAINNRVYELDPRHAGDRRRRAARRAGGRDGRRRDRDRLRHDQRPDRGGAVRRRCRCGARRARWGCSARRASASSGRSIPQVTEWASRRCAELILNVAGGTLHPGVIDVGKRPPVQTPITLRLGQIERVLGITIDRATVVRILQVARARAARPRTNHSLTFRPPSWRSDLEREIDLIEEVARIHGYHHIPEDRAVPLDQRAARQARAGRVGGSRALDRRRLRRGRHVQPGRRPPGGTGRARSGAQPPLRVDHSSRKREIGPPTEPDPQPARRALAQRSARSVRRRAVRDRQRLPAAPRPGAARRADPAGAGLRARLPGLEGNRRSACSRACTCRSRWWRVRSRFRSLRRVGPPSCSLGETHLGYLGEIDPDQLKIFELQASLRGGRARVRRPIRSGQAGGAAPSAAAVPGRGPRPLAGGRAGFAVVRAVRRPWSRPPGRPWNRSSTSTRSAVETSPTTEQSVHFSMTFRHPERTLDRRRSRAGGEVGGRRV